MRKMRTAEEMLAYYLENRGPERKKGFFDSDTTQKNILGYYKMAEFLLEENEYILSFFWGYIYIYMSKIDRAGWIYVLTNKRMIAVSSGIHGATAIDYCKLKNIVVMSNNNGIFFDIDGWYQAFSNVEIDQEDIEFIKRELAEVMPFIREIQEKEAQKKKFSGSPADEIRKFKQLCDDGIITEE